MFDCHDNSKLIWLARRINETINDWICCMSPRGNFSNVSSLLKYDVDAIHDQQQRVLAPAILNIQLQLFQQYVQAILRKPWSV